MLVNRFSEIVTMQPCSSPVLYGKLSGGDNAKCGGARRTGWLVEVAHLAGWGRSQSSLEPGTGGKPAENLWRWLLCGPVLLKERGQLRRFVSDVEEPEFARRFLAPVKGDGG